MGNICRSSKNHVATGSEQQNTKKLLNDNVNKHAISHLNDNSSNHINDNNTNNITAPSDIWTRLQSSPQIGDWLKQVPIFCRVPEDKRNKVGGVMETMTFKSGEPVFEQGDEGDRFYIIKQGIASVTIHIPNPDTQTIANINDDDSSCRSSYTGTNDEYIEKEVARLKQGDYFGETALLSKAKRNATITAVNGDLITLTLDSKTFKKLFRGLNVQLAKRKGVTELNGNNTRNNKMMNTIDENGSMNTEKTEDEINDIVDILNSSVLFERLNHDQKIQIAESMWKTSFGPNQEIGKKGEILSHLFIVKQGIAVKFIEKQLKKTNEIICEREELSEGSFIGEIGLMYNSPLQCTYKTNCDTEHTDFWIISRAKFRKIVKDTSQQKFIEFENFIKTVPKFLCLLEYERKRIAETLEEIHFKNTHIIVKQGDIGNTFYIVRKGTAIVYKDGVEVCGLGPGDFFGERALIKNDVRAASVIVTSTDGMECLSLDREGFTLLLGPLGDIMKRKIDTDYDGISLAIENTGYTSDTSYQPPSSNINNNNNINLNIKLSDLSIIGTLGKG
eukprot:534831_1